MKIEKLIGYLQQIASKHPGITVCVEDGMDPSDSLPITDINYLKERFSNDNMVIQLNSCWLVEQPFDINKF